MCNNMDDNVKHLLYPMKLVYKLKPGKALNTFPVPSFYPSFWHTHRNTSPLIPSPSPFLPHSYRCLGCVLVRYLTCTKSPPPAHGLPELLTAFPDTHKAPVTMSAHQRPGVFSQRWVSLTDPPYSQLLGSQNTAFILSQSLQNLNKAAPKCIYYYVFIILLTQST